MGKTFRRNDYRHPKKDKFGKKSKKFQDFDSEGGKYRPRIHRPEPDIIDDSEFS